MGEPVFFLQIADAQGVVVRLPAGGSLEADLADLITDACVGVGVQDWMGGAELQRQFLAAATEAILAKGVGVFRTQAHVKADIEAGLAETATRFLTQLDTDVRPIIREGVEMAITRLKRQARGAA